MIGWLTVLACSPPAAQGSISASEAIEEVRSSPAWPESSAALEVLPLRAPRNLDRHTIYLMAGHANGGRNGNTGVHGQIEAQVNHDAVLDLARRLEVLDRFDIVIGRRGNHRPSYRARIRHAERVGAEVFIELHTDSRGGNFIWADTPTAEVLRSEGEHGFSILYSDRGTLGPRRRALAATVGTSMVAAGFTAYPGTYYGSTYAPEGTPGVFVDRRGLMMLRRPAMPSIIIETHNARDFEESLRWREQHTGEAFAGAVADALTRLLAE